MPWTSIAAAAALSAALLSSTLQAQDAPATQPASEPRPQSVEGTARETEPTAPQAAEPRVGEPVQMRSGLTYTTTRAGDGRGGVASEGDFVQVHYTARLVGGPLDGRKFDSSHDRGRPLIFRVGTGQVIKGLDEGVAGMREGEQRTLLIPASLGYGARGGGGVVPANQDLQFEVELVRVLPELRVETTLEGSGEPAETGDYVTVHYTGKLYPDGEEGTQFDSSYDRGRPFRVALGAGQVIQGWEEGLVGIREGERRTLIVPPHLGYGEEGIVGGPIPGDATLKFDVEAVEVEPGLRITVEEEGQGEPARRGQQVRVHYTGRIHGGANDGEVFDSSRERGQPLPFTIGAGQVIKGWDMGVAGMKVGEQRTLIIPPEWGYGSKGAGEKIPPNATLRFEVELVEIIG